MRRREDGDPYLATASFRRSMHQLTSQGLLNFRARYAMPFDMAKICFVPFELHIATT
jgi:hypothetical protein